MKMLCCAFIICSAILLLPMLVLADEEMGPYPFVTASELGRYYFKLVPGLGRDVAKDAVGTCYQLDNKGNDSVFWKTNAWYAFKVYLSMNGQYLVRLGNWPRGQKPSADHLAVAFYKNGVLLKSYSTADIIKDVTAVHPSVSHYEFYLGEPVFVSTMDGGSFTLTSVDHVTYTFNIVTGEIISPAKTGVAQTETNYTFPHVIPSSTPIFYSPWSQPVGELIGRLRVELTGEGYFAVFAELKNDKGGPISIPNQLPVTVDVKDAQHKPVMQRMLPVDFISPLPQTAVIPTWGVLALRVDEASVAGRNGKVILQIGGKGWELGPGSYHMQGTLKITEGAGWHGTLSFPEFQVVVPAPIVPGK